MLQSGWRRRSRAPSVALMVPAPMSATSVVPCLVTWSAVTGYPRSLWSWTRIRRDASGPGPAPRPPRSQTTHRNTRHLPRTRIAAVTPTSPVSDAGPRLPALLGPAFRRRDFPLGYDPDGEGPISAVLVRHEKAPVRPEAVLLYVHGLSDYF